MHKVQTYIPRQLVVDLRRELNESIASIDSMTTGNVGTIDRAYVDALSDVIESLDFLLESSHTVEVTYVKKVS